MQPFYPCRGEMPAEVAAVYEYCRSLDTDEGSEAAPEAPPVQIERDSALFDLGAYGPIEVGL